MNSGKASLDPYGDRLMRLFWRRPPGTLAERTRRRVALHLVPFLFFLYILAYIDRSNVAVATLALSLSPQEGGLGFDTAVIGFGSGVFFLGYVILEIPSTLSVERWGARWVFARILVLWGLMAAAMGAVGTAWMTSALGWVPGLREPRGQFYFLRFMLGFFEGGFFPSVIYFLGQWFRREDRAKAIAGFALAMPLSSVIGFPISDALLRADWFGLQGWRWIFIVEGFVPVVAGIATIFLLTDRPEKARWLGEEERAWLAGELEREHRERQQQAHFGCRNHVFIVLLLTAVYFCYNVTAYGMQFFMPSLFKQHLSLMPAFVRGWFGLDASLASGLHQHAIAAYAGVRFELREIVSAAVMKQRENRAATYLAMLPYFVSVAAVLFNGWHSDRKQERVAHAAVPAVLTSLAIFSAWILGAVVGSPMPGLVVLIIVFGAGAYSHIPPFWSIPTMFLGSTAAASAIGFINMTGNLGGFLGPKLLGEEAAKSDLWKSLIYLAPWSVSAAVILLSMNFYRRRKERAARRT